MTAPRSLEIVHLKELMEQHNKLTQLAIDKAEGTMNERLAGMNEFRAQMSDTIARFASNERVDSAIRAVELRNDNTDKELEELKQWRWNMQGKLILIQILWPIAIGVAVFVLSHFYR
jgi:uncharacterized protein YdcH (DUF465 family)